MGWDTVATGYRGKKTGLGSSMNLRPPRLDELPALSDLCLRSKAIWGYDAAFMEACEEDLTLRPRDLDATEVIVAEDEQGVVGVAQVSTRGDESWLEKLFVEPDRLRQGGGRCLYSWALDTARRFGASMLIVEADPDAVAFYERMGARRAGTAPSDSIPGRTLPRLVHSL